MKHTTRTLQRALITVLALIVVAGTVDLVLDRPQRWLSAHVIVEALFIASAAVTVALLGVAWLRERTTAADLRAALGDLSAAIDAQMIAWGLTPAERQVATLLLKGYSHKRIGRETDRSERTVRQHAAAAYQKAGLTSRAELAAFFLEGLMVPKGEDS